MSVQTVKKADPNLHKEKGSIDSLVWHDPSQPPFALEGFPFYERNRNFCRLPASIMPRQREFLQWVAWQPSGGVVRFVTNSDRIAIRVTLGRAEHFPQHALALESGFDIYLGEGTEREFHKNLSPTVSCSSFVDDCPLPAGTKEVTLYFPILNPVLSLEIGLTPEATNTSPPPHARGIICFYGSSITQGFAASRPGLTYPAQVCRALDAQLVNMGFGGNARGDLDVADAISSLNMAAFVLDYDFNSDPDELAANHGPFFDRIRKAHPSLPIVVASAPNWWNDSSWFGQRFASIEKTVSAARSAGDTLTVLLPGRTFWPQLHHRDCTVDGLHPNDRGFYFMTQLFEKELRGVLKQ